MPGLPGSENEQTTAASTSELLELSYYLDKIPTNEQKLDSLKNDRDNSYYNLGIIYKEQFKELDLAKEKLESLLTFNPSVNYSLPAKYHLFKLYEAEGNLKSIALKTDILTNYPNSNYAKIIENPSNALLINDANIATTEYSKVFYTYKEEKFEEVIKSAGEAILKFQGDPIVPKFELLKAYAIGKKDGILAFKEALDFVAMNYPNTEESKKALEVIETIKTKI